MTEQMIQLADDWNADTSMVRLMQFEDVFTFKAGQFLIITDRKSGRVYLVMLSGPQVNLNRNALGPLENPTLAALELVADDRMPRDNMGEESAMYRAVLIADVSDGRARSIRIRPQMASLARAATQDEIMRYLNLPEHSEKTEIGMLMDTDIGVSVDRRVLMYHVLSAGATGSGKSNTGNGILHAAQALDICTFVFDHKPDYLNLDEPNDERTDGAALKNVHYYKLGGASFGRGDELVVPASELNFDVLARTLFHMPGEEMAADAVGFLLFTFDQYQRDRGERVWSLDDFIDWTEGAGKAAMGDLHAAQKRSIMQKLPRPSRKPAWIDGPSGFNPPSFNLKKVIKPGRTNVISIGGGGRAYGLFLSWFLRKVATHQKNAKTKVPVLQYIDEAQDIFNGDSAQKSAMGGSLSEQIRKGRSLKIGFCISVQSAESVPQEIRNNLNTQLIHRHNNHSQVREAIPRATDEQRRMTDSFGPGECLAYMYGANAVIHAQMNQAISNLTKQADD